MSTAKTTALAMHRREYDALNDVLDRVLPEHRDEPGVCGKWSIRQMLAHMSFWNLYPLMMLEYALGGRTFDFDHADDEAVNVRNVAAREGFSFDTLRTEFDVTFQAVMSALEALPDEEFEPDSPLAQMLGDSVDGVFANNTYAHYAEHRFQIEAWLDTADNNA